MTINCLVFERSDFLTLLMKFVSFWGDGFLPVLIVVVTFFLLKRHDKILAHLILWGTFLAHLVKNFLKSSFQIDRPFEYGCDVLTNFADGYSFPSGHVTHFVVFFGLLIFFARKNKTATWAPVLAIFSYLNIVLIGFSRVYLGGHWPKDVLGGYLLGGILLYLLIKIYKILFKNGWGRIRVYDKNGNIQKAGVLIIRKVKNKKEALLLFRKKQNDYTFPKGSLNPGETPKEAAEREVLEETGFKIIIKKKLPPIYYEYPEGDGKVVVHMFSGEAVSVSQKQEKDEHPIWVPFSQVKKRLTHKNLISWWSALKFK